MASHSLSDSIGVRSALRSMCFPAFAARSRWVPVKTIDLPLVWQTVDSSKKVLHLHGISDGDMSDGSEHREREGSICTVYIYIHTHKDMECSACAGMLSIFVIWRRAIQLELGKRMLKCARQSAGQASNSHHTFPRTQNQCQVAKRHATGNSL